MADIRGVGKPITYAEDNPISGWVENLRKQRDALKREPKDDAERELLGRWLGYRGRDELDETVGLACHAYAHFDIDHEWKYLLTDHIKTEAGHGWGYIRQADLIDPERDHSRPDPDFAQDYGLLPRVEHRAIQQRDMLSYVFAGNLWPYGHVTAASIQSILITTPRVLDFEENVVQAEERGHHDALLQKIHDYVWQIIDRYGESYVRKRIAEIDAEALNSRSRTIFDPPRREFLRKYFNTTIDNVARFPEWREYLYESVLGFPAEPVHIKNWPQGIPQPTAAAA